MPPRNSQAVFVRRRTVALGLVLGLAAVLFAAALGDQGGPFTGATRSVLTPAQKATLPWRQRYASGSAGPLDRDGLPSRYAQRAAVRRWYRLGLPIYCAGGGQKYAALTFDDGPVDLSRRVLDMLERARVHSTFFLVGQNVGGAPDVVRREVDAGEVADHTWSHPMLTGLSDSQLRSELNDTTSAIERASGEAVDLMRPPFGSRDSRTDRATRRLGQVPIMWDLDTRDSLGAGTTEIAANADQGMRPGSIILIHDIHDRSVAALPQILTSAKRKQLRLVTVSQLLALDPPTESQVRAGADGCSERQRFQAEADRSAMRLSGTS
jgi:peptidoglycan-N-acetylglucosamine deacetylase